MSARDPHGPVSSYKEHHWYEYEFLALIGGSNYGSGAAIQL